MIDFGDERLAAALWRWWFIEPVEEEYDLNREEAAVADIQRLIEVLDEAGYRIIPKEAVA